MSLLGDTFHEYFISQGLSGTRADELLRHMSIREKQVLEELIKENQRYEKIMSRVYAHENLLVEQTVMVRELETRIEALEKREEQPYSDPELGSDWEPVSEIPKVSDSEAYRATILNGNLLIKYKDGTADEYAVRVKKEVNDLFRRRVLAEPGDSTINPVTTTGKYHTTIDLSKGCSVPDSGAAAGVGCNCRCKSTSGCCKS